MTSRPLTAAAVYGTPPSPGGGAVGTQSKVATRGPVSTGAGRAASVTSMADDPAFWLVALGGIAAFLAIYAAD